MKYFGESLFFDCVFDGELLVKVVDGVDLYVCEVEMFGVVGEFGCGKSILGLVLLNFFLFIDGKIFFWEMMFDEMEDSDWKEFCLEC